MIFYRKSRAISEFPIKQQIRLSRMSDGVRSVWKGRHQRGILRASVDSAKLVSIRFVAGNRDKMCRFQIPAGLNLRL